MNQINFQKQKSRKVWKASLQKDFTIFNALHEHFFVKINVFLISTKDDFLWRTKMQQYKQSLITIDGIIMQNIRGYKPIM